MDVYPLSDLPLLQTDLHIAFLKRLFCWLPIQKSRLVLVADRGYACGKLIRWLKEKGVFFFIRLPCNWCVKKGEGWKKLKLVGVEKGKKGMWWQEVFVDKNEPVKVNLWLCWEEGKEEGWYLDTNLPSEKEKKRIYRLRMGIEECFREKKGKMKVKHFWRWKKRGNVYRMLLKVGFVLLFLFWLYRKYVGRGWEKKQEIWGKLSYVSLGLEWVDAHLLLLFSQRNCFGKAVKWHEIKTDYPSGSRHHFWLICYQHLNGYLSGSIRSDDESTYHLCR